MFKHARFFALFVFFFSSVSFASAYYFLEKEQTDSELSDFPLVLGKQRYFFGSDAGCVGEATVTVGLENERPSIEAEMNFRVKLFEKKLEIPAEFTAHFNALNQLGGSFFSMKFADVVVVFGTTNISPIRLSLQVRKSESLLFKKELSLPGPVEIRHQGGGLYELAFPESVQTLSGRVPPVLEGLLPAVERNTGSNCVESREYWDLAPLLEYEKLLPANPFRFLGELE